MESLWQCLLKMNWVACSKRVMPMAMCGGKINVALSCFNISELVEFYCFISQLAKC